MYASVSHVQELNTIRTFSATSKPTATQVDAYLQQTSAELDAILRAKGYALPIATTATSALKLLEQGNALGAHSLAEEGSESSDRADRAVKLWTDFRDRLQKGLLELDAARDTQTGDVRFAATASPAFSIGMDALQQF